MVVWACRFLNSIRATPAKPPTWQWRTGTTGWSGAIGFERGHRLEARHRCISGRWGRSNIGRFARFEWTRRPEVLIFRTGTTLPALRVTDWRMPGFGN